MLKHTAGDLYFFLHHIVRETHSHGPGEQPAEICFLKADCVSDRFQRDFKAGKCGDGDNCFVEISDLTEYKNISSKNSLNLHFRNYNIDVWKEIVDVFSMRISCLLGNAEVISYEQYLDEANPHDIFICEQALAGNNKVFIISAFPEFLVDYFGMKLWRTCVKHAKNQLDICNCK